ncbi:ABC transporter substrate-binding protein [Paenibacillus mendelii]|uniref:ABC transporter substrate-binding protein n=1 Tax=Paenibacillus mendelii TaxID=206163 RepID=A0ABV6J2L4_9BACL|nr:extracellular solute-binding protein [Paenibacillus mendelii]MCQ6563917.1 extracellular solute-binding protein [Paenibacillus mendelii]
MKSVKMLSLILTLMLLAASIAACSSKNSEGEQSTNKEQNSAAADDTPKQEDQDKPAGTESESKDKEQITLKFMAPWGGEFEERVKPFVEEKFPNIKIELISKWVGKQELEETFAAKENPDILLTTGGFEVLKDMELLYPLDDLANQFNVDLSAFRPGVLESMRVRDPEGENRLLGFPMEDIQVALFYNKSIFDKFGVPYPKDGITWEEVIDLAKKLTGEKDGVKYHGIAKNGLSMPFMELSATGTDPATGEVLFSKEPRFKKYFDLLDKFRSISGNWDVEKDEDLNFQNQTTAMAILSITNLAGMHGTKGLSFDMVRVPGWADQPDITPNYAPLAVSVNPNSEHLKEAFEVIAFLASKEHQTKLHRHGSPSPLGDPDLAVQFGEDQMAGGNKQYNLQGIYTGSKADPAYSPFGPDSLYYGENYVADKATEFITSKEDVVTFLRKMDEDYAIKLKEKMNKK